jgi:predicted transcriptional regulator
MTKQVKSKPFPIREYEALGILAEADATAIEIQSGMNQPAGGRHSFRALERLRAFGHVSRKAPKKEGPGRREYVYSITKKGAKRLEWLGANRDVRYLPPRS